MSKLAVGDRVIISCITSCSSCSYCHRQLPAQCLADEGASGIGWIFGHFIDGTQAESPPSDILPTGFEIGVRNGRVKTGDVVAVIGAGPVGLAAMMTAGLYGASRTSARHDRRAGRGRRDRGRAGDLPDGRRARRRRRDGGERRRPLVSVELKL